MNDTLSECQYSITLFSKNKSSLTQLTIEQSFSSRSENNSYLSRVKLASEYFLDNIIFLQKNPV